MNTIRNAVALAAVALVLAGCSSLGGAAPDGAAAKVLGNLEHCKRTYQASIGGLGVPGGSLYIECPARPRDEGGEAAAEVARP